jgi:RNA polymerase sigma-70 factor (ECF subfamily)
VTIGPTFDSTLAAARTGAEWAWTSLYRDIAPSLLRYLRARGAEDPENTLGEIFVKLVTGLPSFRGSESDFRAWVFTIARNRLVDEARVRLRRPPTSVLPDEPRRPVAGHADDPADMPVMSPDLKRVLDHLTPEQRDVLFLRVLAGLSLDETAQVMGKTTASVKRLQARGLSSLRRQIDRGVVSF